MLANIVMTKEFNIANGGDKPPISGITFGFLVPFNDWEKSHGFEGQKYINISVTSEKLEKLYDSNIKLLESSVGDTLDLDIRFSKKYSKFYINI